LFLRAAQFSARSKSYKLIFLPPSFRFCRLSSAPVHRFRSPHMVSSAVCQCRDFSSGPGSQVVRPRCNQSFLLGFRSSIVSCRFFCLRPVRFSSSARVASVIVAWLLSCPVFYPPAPNLCRVGFPGAARRFLVSVCFSLAVLSGLSSRSRSPLIPRPAVTAPSSILFVL
jgi:hypothetical protein